MNAAAVREAPTPGPSNSLHAFGQRYRKLVHSIPLGAYRMAPEDAEDVYQEVMLKLLDHWEGLRQREDPTAWVAAVTHNECRSHLRRTGRHRWLGLDSARDIATEPIDLAGSDQRLHIERALARAVARLDSPSRELLAALFLEDPTPSYVTIARRLGIPVGSIGPTRARCLAKLRELYGEESARDQL
jgi:RNA polymerase sigma factor (sigma-70 family)